MMKRDLKFVHEDICRNLEKKLGFHLYITEINSNYRSSFFFSFKVDVVISNNNEVEKF